VNDEFKAEEAKDKVVAQDEQNGHNAQLARSFYSEHHLERSFAVAPGRLPHQAN
jgi:hypothetical protein